MDDITPVILSGGSGSRLWPMSRSAYPKQFFALMGELTLIQETVLRVSGGRFRRPIVVCNEEHRFLVAEQLRMIDRPAAEIVLEPVARNTAPAIAAAALRVQAISSSGLMLVMPSDHVIGRPDRLFEAIDRGREAALAGCLVTFGVAPVRPDTGYGYIKAGALLPGSKEVFSVERFAEKPDLFTAQKYLVEGGYSWNSGIFLFSASVYLKELERVAPDLLNAVQEAVANSTIDLTFRRLSSQFATAPSVSIDNAVMEKTCRAALVPVEMEWSDVGAWTTLWEIGRKDDQGNLAKGDVILHDVSNSYLRSDSGLLAVVGLSDVVVVTTEDAVLVARRGDDRNIRQVVEVLRKLGRSEHVLHTTVHRPWGSYRGIDRGDRFHVKQIVVTPGERLSLQVHHHRSEHWVVVEGTALVTCGERRFLLHENESTYIPIGAVHRLENPGKMGLRLIEVQSGGYLGEDDIVRLEDGYGRAPGPSSTGVTTPLNEDNRDVLHL